MFRDAINDLIKWKNTKDKKPIILRGARQVGKTWLMKEFGRTEYKNTVYINFDMDIQLREVFKEYTNTEKLITALEIKANFKIDPNNTLIIFDEIGTCPNALTSLKYFNENAPEYQIIAAGSLLGIRHTEGTGFPVGKVSFLPIYPMSFLEFLRACGEERLVEALTTVDREMINLFSATLADYLKNYYYVGGMPAVVNSFIKDKDYKKVRELQNDILLSYEADFSKHTDGNTGERIALLWASIPRHLAKENSKFIYSAVKNGARAREYETALNWLKDAGLIYKIHKIAKPALPLRAYEEMDAFKVYMLDVGLLAALSGLSAVTLLDGAKIFTEFKGALAEQYVFQQLKGIENIPIGYWTSKSNVAEVDFVAQFDDKIVPIEVKAETNLKAKSLAQYIKTYNPTVAVKTSLAKFEINEGLYNVPLAIIGLIDKILG